MEPPGHRLPLRPARRRRLRSVHTTNFPALLDQLGISLLVTTYQAGKLVVLRADQDHVNTHFRNLSKPMGLAVAGDRLAVGTLLEIWEFHNVPAVIPKLEPIGRHDACYLPRSSHVTGDVQIHEMAWVGDELWFVNTRFSCLCTRSAIHNFVPRWRPPFVSALTPEDRCHLNGLGLRDGQVRYVTALAKSDQPAGWRANKKDGGILMDVTTNEVLVRGLSMPHSPRWYAGRLWVLESGTGGVGFVDPHSGRYVGFAELPGFTRGLDFCGPLAFIGLSQVRESAVFSGIAIADAPPGTGLRRLGAEHPDGTDDRVLAVRGGGPGDLRRPGAAGAAVSGPDQRQQRSVDFRFVCAARLGSGRGGRLVPGPGCGGPLRGLPDRQVDSSRARPDRRNRHCDLLAPTPAPRASIVDRGGGLKDKGEPRHVASPAVAFPGDSSVAVPRHAASPAAGGGRCWRRWRTAACWRRSS